MIKKQEKRTESLIRIRLTKTEKGMLEREFGENFRTTFSDFIRHKLFAKNISEGHQRKYDALIKVGNLRGELNAIGVNINQIAKRMHTYQDYEATPNDRKMLAKLLAQLEHINQALDNI